jgi:3-phenylpropionate/trans-cinnamate dioxygenase ferredoxin reductase component
MSDRQVDVVLVGGGIASATCARTLRDDGFDGSILLVGRETDPPYDRPPCSKDYLAGTSSREDAHVLPAGWYEDNDVELQLRTSAMKLDLEARTVKLSSKQVVGFGKLLLATGANVRRLNVDGNDLSGISYLRALGNSDRIREDAEQAEHVVLIGGSFITAEVAATLTAAGRRCSLVMQESVLFERTLGRRAGEHLASVLGGHGIEFHTEDELERFEGDGDGRVARVITKRGRELPAQAVVIGAGVQPDVMLARAARLPLGERGGVRCGPGLETGVEGVFAAGDIAEWDSRLHGWPLRVEHWDVALQHGRTVARNILGREIDHEAVPFFFSDLADWASLQAIGPPLDWDEEVVRGSLDDGEALVTYLRHGRLCGALSIGRDADLAEARRLLADQVEVRDRQAALADTSADLRELR